MEYPNDKSCNESLIFWKNEKLNRHIGDYTSTIYQPLSRSAREAMKKAIKPIGWRHKFHPQKPYLDCETKKQYPIKYTIWFESHLPPFVHVQKIYYHKT
jgi:hypothetical protein